MHRHSIHHSDIPETDKKNSIIYDPWPLVQGITEGTTSIEDAKVCAELMVEKMASKLGKSGLWGECWGRKRRKPKKASTAKKVIAMTDPIYHGY
jgi:hypothetical protein